MKDWENDVNRQIDQVLDGLRDAAPDEGFERRVLAAVYQHGAERRQPRRRELLRGGFPAGRLAAASAALAVAAMLWIHHGRPASQATDTPIARAVSAEPAELAPAKVTRNAAAVPLRGSASRPRFAQAAAPRRATPRAMTLALVNHPAPEAPLTQEERLLLRIAHRGSLDDVAELNPDARDAQAKADSAEFRKFFGPPPTGDSE